MVGRHPSMLDQVRSGFRYIWYLGDPPSRTWCVFFDLPQILLWTVALDALFCVVQYWSGDDAQPEAPPQAEKAQSPDDTAAKPVKRDQTRSTSRAAAAAAVRKGSDGPRKKEKGQEKEQVKVKESSTATGQGPQLQHVPAARPIRRTEPPATRPAQRQPTGRQPRNDRTPPVVPPSSPVTIFAQVAPPNARPLEYAQPSALSQRIFSRRLGFLERLHRELRSAFLDDWDYNESMRASRTDHRY